MRPPLGAHYEGGCSIAQSCAASRATDLQAPAQRLHRRAQSAPDRLRGPALTGSRHARFPSPTRSM